MTWVTERLYPNWAQTFLATQEVARERSAVQDILIVETGTHGRVMLLDGVVQITEADEYAYQEMIGHVPLIQHGAAARVLIIGAGDGGVLRRVLQHRSVKRVTMVEIDEAVVRLAKAFLPSIAGQAWADPRTELVIGDGIAYVEKTLPASFDVIIVDSTDPAGPGEGLFTADFYKNCARILTPGGLLVNQCGVPFMQPDELERTSALRRTAFACVSAYVAAVPTYVGGFMALGIACDRPIPALSISTAQSRADDAGIFGTTEYWSPAIHVASFALPPFIARLVLD